MKPKLSVIIVHFQAKKELFDCLDSLINSNPKTSYEIIVVDNDNKSEIKKVLEQQYPRIKYLKSKGNIGYGAGNNLGAKYAQGKYLFFLNPDTIVLKNSIDQIVSAIREEEKVGIVAPLLLNKKQNRQKYQSTQTLTPLRGLVAHSLFNRIFPNNPISRNFWYLDQSINETKEVGAVQGSAFLIKSKVFKYLRGFDENFFLFFEETDLCFRTKKAGWKIIFEPKAKVIHLRERGTKDKLKARSIFRRSRGYYFKKNFGIIQGNLTQLVFWFLENIKVISIVSFLLLLTFMLKSVLK